MPNKLKCLVLVALLAGLVARQATAQTFSSGSTGSDGALSFTTPGTYVFDPKTFSPPLNPLGDGIFNFTTITIAAGVTVQLTGAVFNGPVIWLAQGAVKIDGTIDASGQNGFNAANTTQRTYTIPGAGGYPGGYPAIGSNPAGPGLGSLGGATAACGGQYGIAGGFAGNQFLVPLIGGAGGGGGSSYAGGAGGGAILIASSVSISGAGSIKANGGNAISYSGAGAGGAIRLVAPAVAITGALNAAYGANNPCNTNGSGLGVVRVEAFAIGPLNVTGGSLYTASPFGLFLTSAAQPTLRVVKVGGNAVATSPTGTFTVPDVTVNSNAALTVDIEATNIPTGTVATLTIFSENGPDLTAQSTPLDGTLAASKATASVTLPSGFSKGFIKATFTQ